MKVLFIFAHPDDETFGSGGTIAKLIKDGCHDVSVITATDGQAGMTGEYGDISPLELGIIRRKEQSEAAKILGIPDDKTTHLGMMDGTLEDKEAELLKEIKPLLEKENPDVVITFEKHGISNHPDHKMISKVATALFKDWMKKAQKHVRLYHIGVPKSYMETYDQNGLSNKAFGDPSGVPDENFTTIIDTTDVFDLKDKAARAHATQKSDWDRISKRMNHVDLKKEFYELIAEKDFY